MSLRLTMGTQPHELFAKTGIGPNLVLGDYVITMEDFLVLAHYVLTNTDLLPKDPRLQFVKCVRAMKVVDGWDSSLSLAIKSGRAKRLVTSVKPVLRPRAGSQKPKMKAAKRTKTASKAKRARTA